MPSNIGRDRAITELALSQDGFVTAKQLTELGVTSRGLLGLRDRGILRRIVHGVYELPNLTPRNSPDGLIRRAHAACVARGPEALVSHDTAARLWGLDLPTRDVVEITVVGTRSVRCRSDDVIIHRARSLPTTERHEHEQLLATSAAWTLIDLAGRHGRSVMERALDDAIIRKLVRPRPMAVLLRDDAVRFRRGVLVLRDGLDSWLQSGSRPQSVPEATVLRAFGHAGIPRPMCQHKVLDSEHLIAILDFAWPSAKVGVEVDGWRYHSSPSSHANDYLRTDRLEERGWRLVRTTPSAFDAAPGPFLTKLRRLLDERGCQ
jgi:hypothetical protein